MAFVREFRAVKGASPSWDWRNVNTKNFVTAICDQKNCGSCVAFGTVAAIEATDLFKKNTPGVNFDLSEVFRSLVVARAPMAGRSSQL
jgi:C1A family cysteine protease